MKSLLSVFFLILILSFIGCSKDSKNQTNSTDTIIQEVEDTAPDSITIFGVISKRNPLEKINNLIDTGLLTINPDGISIENDSLKAAVVFLKGLGLEL